MTTQTEALKLALEALEIGFMGPNIVKYNQAITAIKEALAQPEQRSNEHLEPVATVASESGNLNVSMSWWHEPALPVGTKLYTTPPQRTWVGLTTKEMAEVANTLSRGNFLVGIQSIETKLRSKNGY